MTLLAALGLGAACGPRPSSNETTVLKAVEGGSDDDVRYSDRKALSAPPPLAADSSDAPYLGALSEQIQPAWSSFLEDCRLRLPASHALNASSLETVLVLVLDRRGTVLEVRLNKGSGNKEFDTVALEIAGDLGAVAAPPANRVSDDDRVYLRWSFARDVRQAGPAQASWLYVELPLAQALPKLLNSGQYAVATKRVAKSKLPASEATAHYTKIAAAVVGAGMKSTEATHKAIALHSVGEADVDGHVSEVRLALQSTDSVVAIAAIRALANLGEPSDVAALLSLAQGGAGVKPEISAAAAIALKQLGQEDATTLQAISGLQNSDNDSKGSALAVLAVLPAEDAIAPLSAIVSGNRKASRDERTAAARALGHQATVSNKAAKALLSGTESRDAAIRAACTSALASAAAAGFHSRIAYWRALELLKDRDERVRAAAILAAANLDSKRFAKELSGIRAGGSKLVILSLAEALAVIPGPLSLDRLLDLSVAADEGMRIWAAKGLSKRSEPKAKEAIEKLLSDSSTEVRLAAVESSVGDAQLSSLLVDTSAKVQARALAILLSRQGKEKTSAVFAETLSRPNLDAETRLLWADAWLTNGE